jgi:phospholipase A1
MLALGITAWYVIDSGDENHDIEDYLGYGRAMVSYSTKGEQINLSSWAGKQGKVSVEANLIIKALPFLNGIPLVGWVLPSTSNTYFWQLQYFDGYGDELLEYDKRQRIARLGLLFTY